MFLNGRVLYIILSFLNNLEVHCLHVLERKGDPGSPKHKRKALYFTIYYLINP